MKRVLFIGGGAAAMGAVLMLVGWQNTQSQVDWLTQVKNRPIQPISLSNPLYLYSHFRDDDQLTLRLSYSQGIANNWSDVNKFGSVTGPGMRDPSVMYVANSNPLLTGTFFFIVSPASAATLQFLSSADLVNYSSIGTINIATYVPGATAAWAPEWWHDRNGNYYFQVAVSTAVDPFSITAPFTDYLFQFNPTTRLVVGTPTPITINGTTQGRAFDFFLYYDGVKYYNFYVDQQNNMTVTQPIAYATSTTLTGPYTQQTTPGADYMGWGTFRTEAPSVFKLGTTGCVRIVVDTWIFPAWGGRKYSPQYRDSCVSAGALFTAGSLVDGPTALSINSAEHGTILPLTDTLSSSVVFLAAADGASHNNWSGRFGINTQNPFYLFELRSLKASSGGIQYPEPAEIAVAPNPDGTEPAILAACGNAAQSCWGPWAGSGRWVQNNSSTGAFGMFQFGNSTAGTGESSIMFGDGVTQFGQNPVSSEGNKAIWTIGENNQSIDLGASNHWFSIYNKGIPNGGTTGGHPFSLNPNDGSAHLPVGVTLGLGLNSLYGHDIYANIDAFGSNVSPRINLGNGTLGNRAAVVYLGSEHVLTNVTYDGVAFAALGTPAPGTKTWCTDCNVATPCTSGGTGAWAFRVVGPAWKCPF
jgi:hypothetical protein